MLNIETILHLHIVDENNKRDEYYKQFKGKHSASSAGYCYKKQYYQLHGYKGEPMDKRVLRLLRLGTLLHKDLEESLDKYAKIIKEKGAESVQIFTEHLIELPSLNVVGHLDYMFIIDDREYWVGDLKSLNDWSWKLKFGKKFANKKQSPHYYLQLGTYCLGVQQQFHVKEPMMLDLTWYNKNDSNMKNASVDPMWIHRAQAYWIDLNDFLLEVGEDILDVEATTAIGIPMMDWECKYCQFNKICKGGMNWKKK